MEQVYLAVIVELIEMLNLGAVDLKSSLSTKLFEILQHFICDCLEIRLDKLLRNE